MYRYQPLGGLIKYLTESEPLEHNNDTILLQKICRRSNVTGKPVYLQLGTQFDILANQIYNITFVLKLLLVLLGFKQTLIPEKARLRASGISRFGYYRLSNRRYALISVTPDKIPKIDKRYAIKNSLISVTQDIFYFFFAKRTFFLKNTHCDKNHKTFMLLMEQKNITKKNMNQGKYQFLCFFFKWFKFFPQNN